MTQISTFIPLFPLQDEFLLFTHQESTAPLIPDREEG